MTNGFANANAGDCVDAKTPIADVCWDDLRDAARRGDSIAFGQLIAGALSPLAGVDLPLCDGCMEAALRRKSRECNDAADERDGILQLQQDMSARAATSHVQRGDPTSARAVRLAQAKAQLEMDEKAINADIAALEARLAAANGSLVRMRSHAARVAALEASTWAVWRETAAMLYDGRSRMASLLDVSERRRTTLSSLRTLSLPGDAFFVWHRGPFGTVNGARLGRLGAGQIVSAAVCACPAVWMDRMWVYALTGM